MRRGLRRGFSLMELMMAMVLATIMLSLGFSNLGKARTQGGSRGLATSVAAEFSLARETAIAKGTPVALVIPSAPGGVSRSLFFLEGNTKPRITRVVNYAGDYPNGTITVATYSGPSFTTDMNLFGSKAKAWSGSWLDNWLAADPDDDPAAATSYSDDFVFLFTPSGEVVTNGLPGAEGAYRVVVSTGAEVAKESAKNFKLMAAGEPFTVMVSQLGSIEAVGGLAGNTSGVGTQGANTNVEISKPAVMSDSGSDVGKPPTIISKRVTPEPVVIDGKETFVLNKGEFLTLEAYATSGDGRALYTSWKDSPAKSGDEFKGRFSVMGGASDNIRQRMDFYPEYEVPNENTGVPTLYKNVWRSVWTWTPPPAAEGGDKYDLNIDVTDFTGNVPVAIKPDPLPVQINLPGEIVFERVDPATGHWQLYTMWADGKGKKQITKGAHDYRCASATANGSMIAYERDSSEVWVMNSDTTRPTKVANGRCPTISPTGDSIAYFNSALDKVYVKRLGTSGDDPAANPGAVIAESTTKTMVAPFLNPPSQVPGNRVAYSTNGRYVYFNSTSANSDYIKWIKIDFSGPNGISVVGDDGGSGIPVGYGNVASGSAEVGGLSMGRKGKLYYHADKADPFIGGVNVQGQAMGGKLQPYTYRKSYTVFELFPAISPNQDQLLYCKSIGGDTDIHMVPIASWDNSAMPDKKLTDGGVNLRPAWIRQRKAITEP